MTPAATLTLQAALRVQIEGSGLNVNVWRSEADPSLIRVCVFDNTLGVGVSAITRIFAIPSRHRMMDDWLQSVAKFVREAMLAVAEFPERYAALT